MKCSFEKTTTQAALAAAIAVGALLASPPAVKAQYPLRTRATSAGTLAQGRQPRPDRVYPNGADAQQRRRDPNNPPPQDRAQRGQRSERDGPRRGPSPGGERQRRKAPGSRGDRHPPGFQKPNRQEVLKFVEKHFPRLWVEMNQLRDRNKERFRGRMKHLMPDIVHLMDVYKNDRRMGSLMIRGRQLDMRIRYAAFQFHKSKDQGEKQTLRSKIHELVERVLDVQFERRALEIASLESRLAELKERLVAQQDVRKQLIEQRVKHLLTNKPPTLGKGERKERDGPPPPPPERD